MSYIVKLSLLVTIVSISVISGYAQTAEPTKNDIIVIEGYIKSITSGWESGYYYKQAIRMGDSTAKALFKLFPEKDTNPKEIVAYLRIVRNAFSKLDSVENPNNRIPVATYQLLQILEWKFPLSEIQSEIKNTREYIEKQVASDPLNRKIEPFSKENCRVKDLLKDIAEKSNIFIGVEVDTNNEIVDTYVFNGGRLIDILNDVVKIHPEYKWVIKEDVVNVFTEHIGKSFVEVGIPTFILNEMTLKDALQALIELAKVKTRLITLGVQDVIVNDFSNKPYKITASFDNIWLFELLNSLVKASSNRIWSVARVGNNIICQFE